MERLMDVRIDGWVVGKVNEWIDRWVVDWMDG
jgi:hypothetical protein